MRDISLAFVLFILAFGACKFAGGKRVTGNGKVITQQRNITGFNAVEVHGSMNVYVSQGADYAVRVEAEENLMDYIVIEKDGEELEVRFKRNTNIRTKRPVKVYVTAPTYTGLTVSGSSSIVSQSKLSNASQINIDISGSGDANLEVDAPTINTEISGSGKAILKGMTRDLSTNISGSGELKAFNLMAETCDVEISGAGGAEVYASKALDANVSGAGNVVYKGSPTTNQRTSGAGSIRKAD